MVKILVPTDYSQCSIRALKHAITLARGSEGTLLILHVTEHRSERYPAMTNSHDDPLRQDVILLLESLKQSTPALAFEERRVEGVPVTAILNLARDENVDMIVMGTSGRTGIRRMLMGSVAEEVCRRAPCPVLTLKANDLEPNEESTVQLWERLTTTSDSRPSTMQFDALSAEEINGNPTYALLSRAIAARASDIHVDPTGRDFVVRFRVDGKLTTFCHLSLEVGRALVTQLKVTAGLDIADPFHPQEGRLRLPEALTDFQVRITCVPVIDGEAISLRVLGKERLLRPLDQLGLSAEAQEGIRNILTHGEGLVLVTGPTGSGKSTTLYSMLCTLDDGARNIVSIEDPVECDIPSFRQVSVDLKHGITLTSGLKTVLRLDPDVVFVGEIRDGEAAETAMRAASSGKYVFSSLHTRDVASTVTALRDLHVDNRSLSGNLSGIVSQRLIRRLCPDCARSAPVTERQAETFLQNGIEPPKEVRQPVGCSRCRGTGYFDRIGVFEVLTSDLGIMAAIENGESEEQLRHRIESRGICSLRRDALRKVAQGITSFDEVNALNELKAGQAPNSIGLQAEGLRSDRADAPTEFHNSDRETPSQLVQA